MATSKIDRLPEDVRRQLITWLSDASWSRAECAEALEDLLDSMDYPAAERPAHDSVNRYARKFSALLQKQRERHEVAATWIGQFGRLPEGQLGQLIIQMVQGLSFEAGLTLDGAATAPEDMPALVRMLKDLATTVERTERASTLNAAREADIRAAAAEEAAALATQAAKDAGLSDEAAAGIGECIRIYLPDNHRQGALARA